MLRIAPTTEAEFGRYLDSMLPEYARDLARAMGWEAAEAREEARAQVDRIVADGVRTKRHHIRHLEADGERVGVLWFAEQFEEAPPRVFLYDIRIDAARRGRGLGTEAMGLLEDEARRLGAAQLMLSVVAHNTGAIRLYERLGFVPEETGPGGMRMAKPIGPDKNE